MPRGGANRKPTAARQRYFELVRHAIESVNARIRQAVRARGHFPNEAATLKCVYMAVMSLDPTGQGRQTLGHALEARPAGFRHRLRRPTLRRPPLTHITRVTPLAG
jgi:hypothetical protein